jgi:hypothetical protein
VRSQTDRVLLGGLAFMVTVCCINMLPNMGLPNLQFMFAAALAILVKERPRTAALAHSAASPPRLQPGVEIMADAGHGFVRRLCFWVANIKRSRAHFR